MRKIVCIVLICFSLCGCSAESQATKNDTHSDVTINLPTDDTVNGYREGEISSVIPQKIPADEVEPAESEKNSAAEIAYIGNAKTRIFHKSTCSSVSTMKEENKVKFEDREDAVSGGYKPCGRCNP